MNVRIAFFILTLSALLAGCGAPKPPLPSGERIPINGNAAETQIWETTDQYDDPVYRN